MNNYIILNKRKNIKNINFLIRKLKLKQAVKNRRTTIWENEDLQISIDKTIIRVFIYDKNNIKNYSLFFLEGGNYE